MNPDHTPATRYYISLTYSMSLNRPQNKRVKSHSFSSQLSLTAHEMLVVCKLLLQSVVG